MKKYFVTGILIWVPILISLLMVRVIFRFSDYALLMLPQAYRPDVLFGFHIPGRFFRSVHIVKYINGDSKYRMRSTTHSIHIGGT